MARGHRGGNRFQRRRDAHRTKRRRGSVSGKAPPGRRLRVTLTLAAGTHTALRLEVLPEKLGQRRAWRSDAMARQQISSCQNYCGTARRGGRSAPLKLTQRARGFRGRKRRQSLQPLMGTRKRVGRSVRARTNGTRRFSILPSHLRLTNETKLRVTLSQQAGDSLTLRRFRLSTSDSFIPRSLHPRADVARDCASYVMISQRITRRREISMTISCACR